MNSLQKDFIERTRSRLNDLSARAADAENLSPEFLRETARMLHTIKGTSQTFGFSASSRLAHELENLLAISKENADLKSVLTEGFASLEKSFEIEKTNENKDFPEKISQTERPLPAETAFNFSKIPPEISERLSDFEKKAFASALAEGKKIFRVNAGFDLKNFDGEFKKLRESLSAAGETIATFPGAQTEKGKIGFTVYFAADDTEKLWEIARNFSGEIKWQIVNFENNLENIFSQIEAHAKELARGSGKEINVTISADKIELAGEQANLIFDVLLHTVRNAVDHGIETPEERIAKNKSSVGKIEIVLKSDANGLKFSVKDDGRGIDTKKLRTRALAKNLISNEKDLTENELLDLIFLHDFSTSETVTEISGRGVGLDAVKATAEDAGGTVRVKSVKDSGTTFEIFLPKESNRRDAETQRI